MARYIDIPGGVNEHGKCRELSRCPICGEFDEWETWWDDWDEEPLRLVCKKCHQRAAAVCGEEALDAMLRDGELERHEDIVREIIWIQEGAVVHYNA